MRNIEGCCEWCRHSTASQESYLVFCELNSEEMARTEVCKDFEREPGADDNKGDGNE